MAKDKLQQSQQPSPLFAKAAGGCNTADLADIGAHCGNNLTGLKSEMHVSPADGVQTISAPDATTGYSTLTMNTGKVFNKFAIFQKENGLTSENLGDEYESQGLKYSVKVFVQKMTAEKGKVLNAANGMNGIYIVMDMNQGGYRVIGEPGNPAVLKFSEQTEGHNGYAGVITWETNKFAPWLAPDTVIPV